MISDQSAELLDGGAPADATAAEATLADFAGWPVQWREHMVQLQKLAAMGTMAAMLAHEFNNLLTRAINYADHAMRYSDDAELVGKSLQKILDNCNQAAEVSRSIFDFAGKSDQRRRPVAVGKAVREAINCLGRDPSKDNIAIRSRVAPGLTVQADATLLQQVLFNLVLNARQAVLASNGRGGRITLSADRTAGGGVEIRVADSGVGIAAEHIGDIFRPFFSTKRKDDKTDRKGIGLGLAICKSIIEDHGGTIAVESVVGQGATFIVTLPGN